ncbi:flagellar motor protein MotB [Thiomicrospira microaerophila]|uniref:OmpA/MotB family protein n=1 Tax=Thiomicrospira microaerophila TaxID=406020 RepID=UPI00200F0CBD|nr:flagellar motor protein MotB [Thiomicrospira microaerophila]UQB42910.1 flagellar motor protein MotB [Thiomicrospira microaerophila]
MTVSESRARSSWLMSFADVVTLLITFFIMMLALYKAEVSQLQKWTQQQMEQSYNEMLDLMLVRDYRYVSLRHDERGIHLIINHPGAFERGGFQVSEGLAEELSLMAEKLPQLTLFQVINHADSARVFDYARDTGFEWRIDVTIEGHTDNDPIDPSSFLRNNWFLSTMRAQNVMQLMHEVSGLPNELFSVAGYGEHRAIAPNDSELNKALNRRVEILIGASFIQSDLELVGMSE